MKTTTSIFLSAILLTAGIAAMMDVAPDAFALKAKGTYTQKFGSGTSGIVCGDRLCSEVGTTTKSVTKTSVSSDEPSLLINTDMGRPVLYLINTNTDDMITVDLSKDSKWPGGAPLHLSACLTLIGLQEQSMQKSQT